MRRDAEVVKKLTDARQMSPDRGAFRRHFEGYELGLVTVGMVLTFALLALPRATVPGALPIPRVDRGQAQRDAREERELALRTAAEGLPYEVRAVGEAVRRFGRSSARAEDTTHERDDIVSCAKVVLEHNQANLMLALRAVQTQYFLRALREFERTKQPSSELDELGGEFLPHARKSGWLDQNGRLLPDEATLRVLFRLRWAELIGKRKVFPFAPTLNEWRIYYRFLVQHPERAPGEAGSPPNEEAAMRLRIVAALGQKDPEYPLDIAQGYLLHQLGDAEGAAVAYRRHLAKHEAGPYALLARNHLIYVLQGGSSE